MKNKVTRLTMLFAVLLLFVSACTKTPEATQLPETGIEAAPQPITDENQLVGYWATNVEHSSDGLRYLFFKDGKYLFLDKMGMFCDETQDSYGEWHFENNKLILRQKYDYFEREETFFAMTIRLGNQMDGEQKALDVSLTGENILTVAGQAFHKIGTSDMELVIAEGKARKPERVQLVPIEFSQQDLPNELSPEEYNMVGMWMSYYCMPSAYTERYIFNLDRSFVFAESGYAEVYETGNLYGKWYISKNNLHLVVYNYVDDFYDYYGDLSRDDRGYTGFKHYTVAQELTNSPRELIIPLGELQYKYGGEDEQGMHNYSRLFKNMRYWKFDGTDVNGQSINEEL